MAIIKDRMSGKSRGFGFVEMSSDAEAAQAIQQLDGKDLQGRPLQVDEARATPATPALIRGAPATR